MSDDHILTPAEKMERALKQAEAERDRWKARAEANHEEAEAIAARERVLMEALRFYAQSWSTPQPRLPNPGRPEPTVKLIVDAGARAREALDMYQ